MKIFGALASTMKKKDKVNQERFDYNRVRSTIEEICEKYLIDGSDILVFEALPSAIDNTLSILDTEYFRERYEFEQTSESLFMIKLKEIDIL